MTSRAALLGTGATNGATITVANTGRAAGTPVDLTSIGSGAALTWDTTRAYHGNASVRLTTGAAANVWARWESMYRPAAGAAQVATVWLYQTAFTPTSSIVFVTNTALQRICEFRVSSAGRIRALNSAGTQIFETTNAIALNQWVRVDCLFTPHASAGTLQVKLYNNPASSTATESTAVSTGQNLRQTQVEQLYIGNTISAASQSCWMQAFVSDGAPPPFGQVGWVMSRWLGAVTESSVGVAARVLGATSVRLVVSTTSDLATSPTYSSPQSPDADGTVRMAVTGLAADTLYYYGIEVDSTVDVEYNGSFRTAPTPGAETSFVFAAASCAANNSNAAVFDAIRAENPRFFVHLGDLHYRDIVSNDQPALHRAMDQVMSAPRQLDLFGKVPVPYIWSDHDSVGPNGDRTGAANPAANAVYRSRVPSHALPATTGAYFAFTWGRVKFVCTDGRSFMDPIAQTDDASKTKLGSTQKAWLISELTDPAHPVKVWCHENAISNGTTFVGDDTWTAYSTERAEILAAIAGQRVAYICGDLHMLAADDGTNVPTVGAASGMPVHVCSPMDNTSFGGNGTYTAGEYPVTDGVASTLYGLFTVTDSGAAIELLFQGKDAGGTVRVTQTSTWEISVPLDPLGQAAEVAAAHPITPRKSRTLALGTATETAQPVARAKTRALGQATATETAGTVRASRVRPVGQAAESAAGQPFGRRRSANLGQAAETGLAGAVDGSKARAVAQAAEAATAHPAGHSRSRTLGQSAEAAVAQPATARKTGGIGQATESNAAGTVVPAKARTVATAAAVEEAQPIAGGAQVPVGQASTTETAHPVDAEKTRGIGQASESGLAGVVAPAKSHAVGAAGELSAAGSIEGAKGGTLSVASEVDAGHPVSPARMLGIGQAGEQGAAHAVDRAVAIRLGQASEQATGLPLAWTRALMLGMAQEAASAFPVGRVRVRTVGQAGSTEEAQPLLAGSQLLVGQAGETVAAGVVAGQKRRGVQTATETAAGGVVAARKSATLGLPVEVTSGAILRAVKQRVLAQATELDTAGGVTETRARLLGQAVETVLAFPFEAGTEVLLGVAEESAAAHPVGSSRTRLLAQAAEASTAGRVWRRPARGATAGGGVRTDSAGGTAEVRDVWGGSARREGT